LAIRHGHGGICPILVAEKIIEWQNREAAAEGRFAPANDGRDRLPAW
jgi:hypothetical protein